MLAIGGQGRGGTVLQPKLDCLRDLAQRGEFPRQGPVLVITGGYCEEQLSTTMEHGFLCRSSFCHIAMTNCFDLVCNFLLQPRTLNSHPLGGIIAVGIQTLDHLFLMSERLFIAPLLVLIDQIHFQRIKLDLVLIVEPLTLLVVRQIPILRI